MSLVVDVAFTVPAPSNTAYTVGQTLTISDEAIVRNSPALYANCHYVAPAASTVRSLRACPAGSTNGTPLAAPGSLPTEATGVELVIPPSGSLTYAIADAQPTSAPSPTIVRANASATDTLEVREELEGNSMVYVTAGAGSWRPIEAFED